MTDRTDDVTERSDPVLVRPYITTGDDDPSAETWPETATLPEDATAPETATWTEADTAAHSEGGPATQRQPGTTTQPDAGPATQRQPGTTTQPDAGPATQRQPGTTTEPDADAATQPTAGPADAGDTAIQPIVAPGGPPAAAPRSASIHWALRLVVLVVGLAVALGIAAYFVRGGSHDDAGRGPSASLPVANPPALTGGGHSAPASARPSSSPSRSASSSPSAAGSLSVLPPATHPASSAPATGPTGPTLAAPPAADRTGRVTSAGGRCLVLGGLLGLDGSPIQVMNCVGGTAQQFTLATDGTLQVAGHCAEATGDASVRSAGCDGAGQDGQWRAGPSGSLVNSSTSRCLTDPGRSGATTAVAACTGGDDQRWTLP